MKNSLIFTVFFLTKTIFAQQSNIHEISYKEISKKVWYEMFSLSNNIKHCLISRKIAVYQNIKESKKIENVDFENYLTIKSNEVMGSDGQIFSYEESASIVNFNKIRICKNGFEFILNPKLMFDKKYFNDTDIVMFFIDNKNLKQVKSNYLAKRVLYYFQINFNEVKEININNCGVFVYNLQKEFIMNKTKKMVHCNQEGKFLINDSLNKMLLNLRYINIRERISSKLENDSVVISESPFLFIYEANSIRNRINLEYLGFGFCLGECINGGINYNFEYFFIKRKNIKKTFSNISHELVFGIIDLYLIHPPCW